MQLVLSWPVRVLVIALLAISLFVDAAGYLYRLQNHLPLTGPVSSDQMPPHFDWWPATAGDIFLHKGLDLQGGSRIEVQLIDIPKGASHSQIQSTAVSVFSSRLNALGVSEPQITPEGGDRIIIELAGVNSAQAQDVVSRQAHLDFTTWVADAKAPAAGQAPAGFRPQKTGLGSAQVSSASSGTDQTGTQYQVNLNFNSQGASTFNDLTTKAVNACPGDTGSDPNANCAQRHIAIFEDLTDDDIANWAARATQLALPPDQGGKMLTNPVIQNPIPGGQAVITGNFSADSARTLAIQINSGALPASVKVLSSTDVGATLGQNSVTRSIAAGLIGLAIVVIFMVAYYRLPGVLASLALLGYAGITIALFKIIPVTLTLAGLAGFILSVGMAVDANVLIFERFKEEMRAGRTVGAAVDAAVRRAWPAIRDSNSSTLITCVVLGYAAQGSPVQGFAITLGLGVVVSLLSSIIITHNLLAIVMAFHGGFRNPRVLGVQRGSAL